MSAVRRAIAIERDAQRVIEVEALAVGHARFVIRIGTVLPDEAITAALDPRLISPNLEDHPESKVNVALRRVVSLYKSGTPRRETQIIFSDLRNQFKMDYLLPFTGHPFPEGSEGSFDLYKDIKAKLVAAGQ